MTKCDIQVLEQCLTKSKSHMLVAICHYICYGTQEAYLISLIHINSTVFK